jgi:hypothetical protein
MKTVKLASMGGSGKATIAAVERRASLLRDMVSVLQQCHFLLLKDYPGTPGNDQPVAAEVRKLFDETCEVLARAKAEGI